MTRFLLLALGVGTMAACSSAGGSAAKTLVIYDAASLAAPMRALLDTFAHRNGVTIQEEHGASLELARRVTDLHRVPDVIALADREVFPELLMPVAASWYAGFARNRMVVAYTRRSRGASRMSSGTWRTVLLEPGVLVGRTDPMLAPVGYRALIVFRLAERFYRDPGLAERLKVATPATLMRGNAADLAALLAAGELDYIIDYESLARAQHFQYVTLPPEIDLGDPGLATAYAAESVSLVIKRGGVADSSAAHRTVVHVGAPIVYGVSVPRAAPHRAIGEAFVKFLLSAEGRAMLRTANVDALDTPVVAGDSAPPSLRAP